MSEDSRGRCYRGAADGRIPSHRPRHRPGADRVPAGLEHGPPADRAGVPRLGGPGLGVHRRHPARDARRGADLLPRRPVEDRPRLGAQPAPTRSCAGRSTRGWAGTSASARSRSASSGWSFNDQIETGARSLYLIGTTLIVLGLLLLVAEQVAKRERTIEDINAAGRGVHRLRAGLRAGPGRLALGRDDHRGPVLRLRPRVRRALLVPALGPRRRALRPVRAAQDRRPGRRRRGPDVHRHRRWPSSSATRRSRGCCAG